MKSTFITRSSQFHSILLIILMIFCLVTPFGCGGGGGGGDSSTNTTTTTSTPTSTPTTTTPTSTPTTSTSINTVLGSGSVLPTAGGSVLIVSEDIETNGASLDIPARAVSNPITLSMGTIDSLPEGSPFGQSPVGKLFGVEPSGQTFPQGQEATLTLPIPPGEKNTPFYIGRWNPTTKKWENLGGTIAGDFISINIDHLSTYGVFYARKVDVKIVNNSGPQADLGIKLLYVSGPAIPPDTLPGTLYPSYRPLPEGGIELKDGESWFLSLLPGRYHFLVTYPHPQPGVANSLWFTVPAIAQGADDGQIDQTITITLAGATSTDPITNASLSFPGYGTVPGSNLRPIIACTATAPPGVAVVDAVTGQAPQPDPQKANPTRIVNVGPIKIEQLSPKGALTLFGKAHDPENSAIDFYWTWPDGSGTEYERAPSDVTVSNGFLPNPPRGQIYTAYLTAYDQYDLFDECRWRIDVRANTKPTIKALADDLVIDFGRLDHKRRLFAPQPAVDAVPTSGSANAPAILPRPAPITTTPFGNLCAYVGNTTYLRTLPGPDGVDPNQYPEGMTCVYAIVADADNDPLYGGFRIPEPLMGRGTLYAAVPVPNKNQGGAGISLLDIPPKSPPRMVSDILPDGLVAGSIIDTYAKMDAYNATITFLANRRLLPVTGPLLTYPPLQPIPPGAQALPVIWEAPDDPDSVNKTHDCVTHRFQLDYDPLCTIRRGGTVNIQGWVTDSFSPEQRDFALVAFPNQSTVFPDDHILLSITPNPADPGPHQGVTVIACVAPPDKNVSLDFSIVGTDKYSNAKTVATGDDGCASFYIPGGAKGVVDVVTVKLGGLTSTVTYTF